MLTAHQLGRAINNKMVTGVTGFGQVTFYSQNSLHPPVNPFLRNHGASKKMIFFLSIWFDTTSAIAAFRYALHKTLQAPCKCFSSEL